MTTAGKTIFQITAITVELKKKKIYPKPGLEPGPLALRTRVITTKPPRTSTDP